MKHTVRVRCLGLLAALVLGPFAMAQQAGTVKITPVGAKTGEYCPRDPALIFEDPTGIRIPYDPGITVAGGGDTRLGAVDAILVSHNHFDHLGYTRLTQNPDDPGAICGTALQATLPALQAAQTGNTTTAEIAATKNSAVLVNPQMAEFLAGKIQNILAFINGLKVYLSGDTGPTSDMTIMRDLCRPQLAVVNVDGVDSMGPEEAAYAMKQLVRPTAVIVSHAEEAVTTNGRVNPETRTAQFIGLLDGIPVYIPLSGRTMEFDGDGKCTGCSR